MMGKENKDKNMVMEFYIILMGFHTKDNFLINVDMAMEY